MSGTDRPNVSVYGTKCSGIGTATGAKNVFTTDVWDGTSYAKINSDNIYTSGSFARLTQGANASADVKLYLDIDLNNKPFNDATTGSGNPKWGIVVDVAKLSSAKAGSPTPNAVIKNLNTTTGLFRNRAAALELTKITVNTAKLSAAAVAGTIIGNTAGNLTLTDVKVIGSEVNTGKSYVATAQDFGGMVGNIAGGTTSIDNSSVENITIHGHYHMGGFIGSVASATKVEFKNKTKTNGLTFDVQSADNKWGVETGTIAPFIGGITGTLTDLDVNNCSYASTDLKKNDWNYSQKFLKDDESMIFVGTNRVDTHFIGYVSGSIGTYKLKLESGFVADPAMQRWNETATPKPALTDLSYNGFAK